VSARLKNLVLSVVQKSGLALAARAVTRRSLRILCYHGIWHTPGPRFSNCVFIEPDHFANRMLRLKQSGRPVLPLDEAIERLASDDLPEAAVVITIDDGWVSTLSHMLPVLEDLDLPATTYSTTWYSEHRLPVVNVALAYLASVAGKPEDIADGHIARIEALPLEDRIEALRELGRQWNVPEAWLETRQFELLSLEELSEMRRRGMDIQLHTHDHIDISMEYAQLPQEVARNREALEAVTGSESLRHFCYPSGTYHPDAPRLLADSGVRSATLTSMGLNRPGCDLLALRRFLDCRDVTDLVFDSYLSGTLELASGLASRVGLTGRPEPGMG